MRSCVKSKSACPFSEVGCKSVVCTRKYLHFHWMRSFPNRRESNVQLRPQIENGKLSEHEQSSTMEHLRLLLPMVRSMTRVQTEVSDSGEWQEDSGLGLYRAPEEGVDMGAGATASVHAVDLETKVRLNARRVFLFWYFTWLFTYLLLILNR